MYHVITSEGYPPYSGPMGPVVPYCRGGVAYEEVDSRIYIYYMPNRNTSDNTADIAYIKSQYPRHIHIMCIAIRIRKMK